MRLQYRWQIRGTLHGDGVQEICHEGDSRSDSLESCKDEDKKRKEMFSHPFLAHRSLLPRGSIVAQTDSDKIYFWHGNEAYWP